MAPAFKTFRVKRWPLVAGVSAALLTGVGIVAAASPRHAANCKCADGRCADGVCTPNVYSYGYYQTHWRSWPKAAAAEENESEGGKLPTQVEPPATQEDLDAPPRPTKKVDGSEGVHPTGGEHPFGPADKPNPFKDDEDQTPAASAPRPVRPAAAQAEGDTNLTSLSPSSLFPPANGFGGAMRPAGSNPIRGQHMDAVRAAVASLAAESATTEPAERADAEPVAGESSDDESAADAEGQSGAASAEGAQADAGVVEVAAPRNLLRDKVSSAPQRAAADKSEQPGAKVIPVASDAPEPGKSLRLVNAELDPRAAKQVAQASGQVCDADLEEAPAADALPPNGDARAEDATPEDATPEDAANAEDGAKSDDGANPLRASWGARRAGSKSSTPEVTTRFNPLRK
jgi:hypothetical protein